MSQLVEQHEQHIAGYELDELLALLLRQLLQPGIILERAREIADPRLKSPRLGRRRLCVDRPRAQQQERSEDSAPQTTAGRTIGSSGIRKPPRCHPAPSRHLTNALV